MPADHRRGQGSIDMTDSQKYNAALTYDLLGWATAIRYIQNCIGVCVDSAMALLDEIIA